MKWLLKHIGLKKDRNEEIIKKYYAGTSMNKLAKEYGIATPTVKQIIDRGY